MAKLYAEFVELVEKVIETANVVGFFLQHFQNIVISEIASLVSPNDEFLYHGILCLFS
jgi:hypothetical protein